MREKLIIFPFGGNGREAAMTILDGNKTHPRWEIVGFIDDDKAVHDQEFCGVKVLGGKEVLKKFPQAKFLAVPGNPKDYLKRKKIIDALSIPENRFAQVIHPSAVISLDVQIGYNTLIMPNVIISCGAKVGDHCMIFGNSVIAHDSKVSDYCCVGYNVSISGHVALGTNCYIGSGSSIRDHIVVDSGSLVGLGSAVVKNVAAETVVAGNPAKLIRKANKL